MSYRDLYLTDDGDLITINIDGDRDFGVASAADAVKQQVMARIKTQNPDWYTYINIGANLEDFIGEPNTPLTASNIIREITRCLTYDSYIRHEDLEIYAVPITETQIIFYVSIDDVYGELITVPVAFNVEDGIEVGD